jgi:chaperonin cofactor prefoldin
MTKDKNLDYNQAFPPREYEKERDEILAYYHLGSLLVDSMSREDIADEISDARGTKAKQAIDSLVEQERLKAKIDELTQMLSGFNKGLKGQSPEFKYTMRPIMASIEKRIAELKEQLNKELSNDQL